MNTKNQSKNISQSKKDSTKSVEKNKKETTDKTSKVGSVKKSASQLSISHFSSVSTPEYREGWERIWGGKKSDDSLKKNSYSNSSLIDEIVLTDKDLSENLKLEILKELVIYSTKKGLDLTKTKDLDINVINFSCVLKFQIK
jgi:hypothetical protein